MSWDGSACKTVLKHCGYDRADTKEKKQFWEEKARTMLKEAMAQLRNGAVQRAKESLKAYYASKYKNVHLLAVSGCSFSRLLLVLQKSQRRCPN